MGTLQDALRQAKLFDEDKSNIGTVQKPSKDKKSEKKNEQTKKTFEGPAAPYNFVKLNDRIVEPPLAVKLRQKSFADFIQEDGKYSGYFEVAVENKTPLYIAGTNGFFCNGSHLCIPGSSVRGCLKNTFKIITNSSFRSGKDNLDLTDKRLYFRTFASAFKPLRNAYSDRITQNVKCSDGKMRVKSIAKAGFLVREDKKYFICPAEYKSVKGTNEAEPRRTYVWSDNNVEVHTGNMYGKKHFYVISHPLWQKKMPLDDNIINDYLDDKTRKGTNLLDKKNNGRLVNQHLSIFNGASAYDFIVPCFYVAEGDVVKHFGAGLYYRIPYLKSIGEHIPTAINRNDVIDFTDAVFGCKEAWSSRIFFDDLYLVGTPQMEDTAFHKILATPNPTSFQFYLNLDANKPAHWDACTDLRGYKMYWHRHMDWKENDYKKQNEKMTSMITPVSKGHTFVGRVRFENLDAVELGAVCALFALGNAKGIAYKLGMGKPIGMGTVKLSAKLHLQSSDYYQKLFATDGFATCEEEADIDSYVAVFNKYMEEKLQAVGGNSLALYRERMRELRLIMNTNVMQKPYWEEKTRYMDISKDKKVLNNRKPLPSIEEVVK